MRFDGQVAIITGSATGIGAACALKLAERGAKVVINFTKSEAEAKETLGECRSFGAEGILAQGDVAEDVDCRRIAKAALDKWGRIDILINNAGTTKFNAHGNLDGLTAEDFAAIYRVNVVGSYQMTRACAPAMKAQGSGSVVMMSSIAGVVGVIGSSSAYAASKGALNTLTLSLAKALAPEIRVNAICPGFVGTRWFKDRFGEAAYNGIVEQQRVSTPLKRAGTPADIADATLFFASQFSRHVTGETLLVDAGLHLDLTPVAAR